jgi:hypothetical protein
MRNRTAGCEVCSSGFFNQHATGAGALARCSNDAFAEAAADFDLE